jgi:dTDP-4-amino-4,6-dideoxygalactose transaminase
MNRQFNRLAKRAKPWLRPVARATLGKLPPPASRLTGRLARDGGKPVRDVRLRPWVSVTDGNFVRWHSEIRAAFRRIFLTGVEGLPQPIAREFAQQWAAFCGCRHAILLPHGTDALRLSLAAVLDHDGLEYGGEVIVPNYSFLASAAAPLDRRFGVVFVDVDQETLLLDPKCVEEAIIPGKTRAILPVHLFGQPADMTALRAIAEKHALKIVEDAAQAHGAVWESGPVGCLGDAAGFSFQSTKNLHCGEGGAVTTNDDEVFDRVYSLQNAGRSRTDERRWEHVSLGWNCRPTEYQAALLLHSFRFFEQHQAHRRKNFDLLRERMAAVSCLQPLGLQAGVRAHGMYMFAMRYKPEFCGRYDIDDFLDLVGAEGGPVYRAFTITMSDQPAMKWLANHRSHYLRRLPTPVSDRAVNEIVYIPQQVFLGSARDMEDIVAIMRKVERHCARHSRSQGARKAA